MEIYYFSGTGNSLHVARELKKRIPETKLIPMVSLLQKDITKTNDETVGFVFPLYLTTVPAPVRKFLRKLNLTSTKYIFTVMTRIGTFSLARTCIENILKKKDKKLEKLTPEPSKKKSRQVSWGTSMRLFALFLVFIAVIEGYLWMYPDVGYQTIEWMHSSFPVLDQLLGTEKAQQDIITDQVEFINVKQRFVKNESLGNVRVIEGEVVNRADFPIAKIKVMGELFNSSEALLAARIAHCGNVLPDEILGRLKEEEIRTALSISPGGNLPGNKIMPKGQSPFMIVFTHEPAGVAKATVTAVGAERISP